MISELFKEGTIWKIEHFYTPMWGGKPQEAKWHKGYYYIDGGFLARLTRREGFVRVLSVNRWWTGQSDNWGVERAKKGKHAIGNRCIYEITDEINFIPLNKIRKLHKVAEIKLSESENEL
jgi:hypothetical protein